MANKNFCVEQPRPALPDADTERPSPLPAEVARRDYADAIELLIAATRALQAARTEGDALVAVDRAQLALRCIVSRAPYLGR